MPKNFNELRTKMSPAAQAKARAESQRMIQEYALDELREARAMTQVQIAEIMGKDQSVVSRIEKRTDMYVSTLAQIIRAMGGELEVRAVFPEGTVRIKKFRDIGLPRSAQS